MKAIVLFISLFVSFTITSCIYEHYETIPLEGVNFCAFRHDSGYFQLYYYNEEEAQERVVCDYLQSVLYGNNVIMARCALNRDFFVRYYFVTFDSLRSAEFHNPFDTTEYHVSGPISEQACLDSLKVHNLEPSKMKIVNFDNFDSQKF